MNKETVMRRISELTLSGDWQEDETIVAEVQKLGKILHGKEPRGRKKPKKIAVWHNDQILVTGTARELEETLGMKEQTIRNWIWKKRPDLKGRLFKYAEEEK